MRRSGSPDQTAEHGTRGSHCGRPHRTGPWARGGLPGAVARHGSDGSSLTQRGAQGRGVASPKPPARDEARNALCDGGVRACEICRPDSERGIVK
ncbi:DUF6233 domain-containing protein [Streptomyces sp. NBC_01142]|uniref:DUF6233 domain-containing protein n=1 Tax=Streptomyces sp. NBC_01142 TaxID=2975865 RepID=UPI00338FDCB3